MCSSPHKLLGNHQKVLIFLCLYLGEKIVKKFIIEQAKYCTVIPLKQNMFVQSFFFSIPGAHGFKCSRRISPAFASVNSHKIA